jgi:hypothetical protein
LYSFGWHSQPYSHELCDVLQDCFVEWEERWGGGTAGAQSDTAVASVSAGGGEGGGSSGGQSTAAATKTVGPDFPNWKRLATLNGMQDVLDERERMRPWQTPYIELY